MYPSGVIFPFCVHTRPTTGEGEKGWVALSGEKEVERERGGTKRPCFLAVDLGGTSNDSQQSKKDGICKHVLQAASKKQVVLPSRSVATNICSVEGRGVGVGIPRSHRAIPQQEGNSRSGGRRDCRGGLCSERTSSSATVEETSPEARMLGR